jgi:hypothetical protein
MIFTTKNQKAYQITTFNSFGNTSKKCHDLILTCIYFKFARNNRLYIFKFSKTIYIKFLKAFKVFQNTFREHISKKK